MKKLSALKLNNKKSLSSAACLGLLLFFTACQQSENISPVVKKQPSPSPNPPPNLGECHNYLTNGYTDHTSYKNTDTIKAYLNFTVDTYVCNLNVYNIDGSVAFSIASPTNTQTIGSVDPSVQGFGYKSATLIPIPKNLKSGVYLIENSVPFIVKPSCSVDVLVLYPSNTINAYSNVGGKSMYDPLPTRPTHASFQRPSSIQWQSEVFLRWIATQKDLSVGYICDMDMDDMANLNSSNLLIIPGHSEYWSRAARVNFDSYIDQGKHAIILSGNTMWWQVRYSDDKTTMICYKDSNTDPESNPLLKTITWDQASLNYFILPSIGADFNHGGYGIYNDNGWDGYKIVTPQSPLFEGLSLTKGNIISLTSGEYDGVPISNFDANGYPIVNTAATGFKRIEILGFDKGSRGGNETIGTFFVGKKSDRSGIIINGASYDWCSYRGMGGPDGDKIKKITINAIQKLLRGENVFSN